MLQNSSAFTPSASKECSQGSQLQGPCCQRTETGNSFIWYFSGHSIWSKLDLMTLEIFSSLNDSMMPGKCPRLLTVLKPNLLSAQCNWFVCYHEAWNQSLHSINACVSLPHSLWQFNWKNSCKKQRKMFTQQMLSVERTAATLLWHLPLFNR